MLNNTDMIFNGVPISSFVVVEKIVRPMIADLENSFVKVPDRDGMLFQNKQLNEKRIEVSIRAIEDDRKNLSSITDRLADSLVVNEPKKLILRDKPGRYDLAILESTPNFDIFRNTAQVTLNFVNYAGVMFSENPVTVTSPTFTNSGTADTYVTLKVTSNGTNPAKVVNAITGDSVTLEGLATGQVVEIDFEEESVKVDSNLRMDVLWLESDFWKTKPGLNEINLTNLTLNEITYQERWL